MTGDSVPKEQLERIAPVVDALIAQLRDLVSRLPPNTDSAMVFRLQPEEHR